MHKTKHKRKTMWLWWPANSYQKKDQQQQRKVSPKEDPVKEKANGKKNYIVFVKHLMMTLGKQWDTKMPPFKFVMMFSFYERFYVGCDLCNNWFHGDCVGITEDASKEMDEFICAECKHARESQELYCLCKQPYDESQ